MVTTGQSGAFRFLIVPAGSYTIRIEPPYQPPVVISPVVVAKNEITDLGTIEICPDNDNDGFTADLDCNDNNASVYPGAEEVCDGFDNNCDAIVDEGCLTCTDEDRDSFFAQAGCNTDVDCNDDDPLINPGANEICGNGVDDDCDGAIDDGCPDDMDGDGFPGDVDCNDENPNVFPGAVEECNGVDDDCNGGVDLFSQSCYSGPSATLGIGQCVSGSSTCEIGVWTSCIGEVGPSTETCDGIDNDCDGTVDEDTGIGYCDSGLYGVCAEGVLSCSDGSLSCESIWQPSMEIYDGLDNDCDGEVDEGFQPPAAYTHTITIDGINDFNGNERFLTTSLGYTAYVTWDSQYLFVGLEGQDLGPGSSADKFVLIYIGGPDGTTTGQIYNNQVPRLAFEAKYHIRWRTDGGYTNAQVWNESWTDVGWNFSGAEAAGPNFLEMRIPMVDIGSPPTARVHISLVNESSGFEWTYAGVPATSFIDGFDPDYGHYFEFDRNSDQAPISYPPL